MNRMEALIWILLPGFTAVASGLLAWFIIDRKSTRLNHASRPEATAVKPGNRIQIRASMRFMLPLSGSKH